MTKLSHTYLSSDVNPRAAGVSGLTRRAGGWGKYYLPPPPLVISGTKHRRETGQAAIEALNKNLIMHA